MEYRDVHDSKDNVESYMQLIEESDMSAKQKKDILEFVKLLRIGKIGKKVKDRKIASYLQFLMKLHKYFQKDLGDITEQEAEKFYEDLEKNKIKKNNGMPYSEESKNAFVVTLKRYIGYAWDCWDDKKDQKYRKSLGWMKELSHKSNKRAITLQQTEKVLSEDNTIRNKCLFMFGFDSGGRIEEILNVRIGDLLKSDKSKDGYFMVHLRGTKTGEADRTLAIPLTTKYLNAWLKEHPTKEDNDFLFPINYDNARKIIKEMSMKVLGFAVKPHELRHSSATHYIQHGGFGAENIGGFYYRYGWKFGSKEALTYIKTHLYGGEIGQDKVVKHIVSDRVEKLEEALEAQKKEMDDLIKRMTLIEKYKAVKR